MVSDIMVKDFSDMEREKCLAIPVKEGNVLFNDALNTLYLRLYVVFTVICLYLMGYFLRLAARILLYAPSHRHDSTYHGLYYTVCRLLPGTRSSS